MPKTNTDFWLNKINGNITNDSKVIKELKKDECQVIVIWECGLKKKIESTLVNLVRKITDTD